MEVLLDETMKIWLFVIADFLPSSFPQTQICAYAHLIDHFNM